MDRRVRDGQTQVETGDALDREVEQRLAEVTDPELPVPIVELGMVRSWEIGTSKDGVEVGVALVPTFLGCPAQFLIEAEVRRALESLDGISMVEVAWLPSEQWSLADVSPGARRKLAEVGVAVPSEDGEIVCPNCGEGQVVIDSEFGATLCRRHGHCAACGDVVEVMKAASPADWPREGVAALPLVFGGNPGQDG